MNSVWQGTATGLVTQMATKWKLAGQDKNCFKIAFIRRNRP